MPINRRRIAEKINTYSLYGIALFPLTGFALTNIALVLFLLSFSFLGSDNRSRIEKKELLIGSLFPLYLLLSILWDTQPLIGLAEWTKLLPILVLFILCYFKKGVVNHRHLEHAERLFAWAVFIHVLIFFFLLIQFVFFEDQAAVLNNKKIFFYSDVIQDLGRWKNWIAVNYHKPYLSMCILLALFIALSQYFRFRKVHYLLLAVFYLLAILYFFSIPNVMALILLLPWWLYSQGLLKKKRNVMITYAGLLGLVIVVLGISFRGGNKDITRDFNDLATLFSTEEGSAFESDNPRGIIYSSLLTSLKSVPFFGFGMNDGSKKIKEILYRRICKSESKTNCRNNLLVSTEDYFTFNWKRNGLKVQSIPNALRLESIENSCGAHTFYQHVEVKKSGVYSLSLEAKGESEKVILRIGDVTKQRVAFDFERAEFSYLGSEVLTPKAIPLQNGYFRIHFSTFLNAGKAIVLFGFSGTGKDYNHCLVPGVIEIKHPQLETGRKVSSYRPGLTEIEDGIITKQVNAHSSFLEYFFAAGYMGLAAYVFWYISLGRIALYNNHWVGIPLVLLIGINSAFEHILIRQWGLNIVFFLPC